MREKSLSTIDRAKRSVDLPKQASGIQEATETDTAPINIEKKFALFDEHWSPRVIAEPNDYQYKLAKFQGEFVWHDHKDTDEVFIVMDGELEIAFRDRTVRLHRGEILVVPKGVQHKPRAEQECKVMLVEPKGVVSTGDRESALTADLDVWI